MNCKFKIFPVAPNKKPLISGWQEKATRKPDLIAQWEAQGARAWGIPCGADNGLFVIDLDVDKESGEPVGEASLKALPRYAGLLNNANVRTPTGGIHIYCKHFDGGRNTTSKIGPKIDTRGQGGYVIAPSSTTDSGYYEGTIPEVLPVVPTGLRAILLHTPPPTEPSWAGQAPTGAVAEILGHIPADLPYQDWLVVLMGLHDHFKGSEEGLFLAEQWSATGTKYRAGEVATKWLSFKRNGVTFASVAHLARQHGANLAGIARKWSA